MKFVLVLIGLLPSLAAGQDFACPAGQADMMKYFVLSHNKRDRHFLNGQPNPIFTEVFPDQDFARAGYWFWLKSSSAHGFDVKVFDEKSIFMRSTELEWNDNASFKRFEHDLPVAARCIGEGQAGPEIKVADTAFQFFSGCHPYRSSTLGTAINDLDRPERMDTGGKIGIIWTRVLHYRYDCDNRFRNCKDEEQFYLGEGYGLWQWKYFRNGEPVNASLMNELRKGKPRATLPCAEAYR
jgi:hypothetical protein